MINFNDKNMEMFSWKLFHFCSHQILHYGLFNFFLFDFSE